MKNLEKEIESLSKIHYRCGVMYYISDMRLKAEIKNFFLGNDNVALAIALKWRINNAYLFD